MRYDEKKLNAMLQDVSKMLYAASEESIEAYDSALGEADAWLEGHKMHHQEMQEESEDE